MSVLHDKYRPDCWHGVLGNEAEVQSLRKVIEDRSTYAVLLSGPSGTGKTTLARIAAKELKAALLEFDAASRTGVKEMRDVQDVIQYLPFGYGHRAVLIDESHSLSANAWESLQKVVEEPPAHVTWFFCTTKPEKVPTTIKTRCTPINLKPLKDRELKQLIGRVVQGEQISLPDKVEDLIVFEARGSARQALVFLDKVAGLDDYRDAAAALSVVLDNEPIREFCRFICRDGRRRWSEAMHLLEKLDGEDAESVRILVCNYAAKAVRSAKSDEEAIRFLRIIDAFAGPYQLAEQMAPLYSAIGRVIYNGGES